MKHYPRTFLQLITWGQVIVLVPFVFVSVYVLLGLQVLDGRYRETIELTSLHARLSSELAEDLIHMEKSLRGYEILRNQEAYSNYLDSRQEWRGNVEEFLRIPAMPQAITDSLHAHLQAEEDAFATFDPDAGETAPMYQTLDSIRHGVVDVLDQASEFLDLEKARFFAELDSLRMRLAIFAAIGGLLTILTIWRIRRHLSRLITRFEAAVIALGRGDLETHIELDGPDDLRWLGRWLEWLRNRLQSLEQSRTQVLHHLSHELKTPLAAINEGTSLLAEELAGPLASEQRRIVDIVQNNSRRLLDLIEGLLLLQQAGHAAERIPYRRCQVDRVIKEVIDTCSLIAKERDIQFDATLPPVDMIAGEEALLTIVHNLISNAIKFSPEHGRVNIGLSASDSEVVIEIRDQGAGIADDERSLLFEPFCRGKNAKGVPGVGLGLSVTREFVLAHRGKLQLLPSTVGAHFRVVLPRYAEHLKGVSHE